MSETLKPCPWCGKPGRVITPKGFAQGGYQVVCAYAVCPMYAVQTFAGDDREKVVEAWNNRVIQEGKE